MRRILLLLLFCGLLLCGCTPKTASPTVLTTASAPQATPVSTAAAEKNAVDRALFDLRCEADDGVLRALNDYYRSVLHMPKDFDTLSAGSNGADIMVYAVVPYRNGMLALASFALENGFAPDLIYIEEGEALYATRDASALGVTYTRFNNDKIVFGKSFAWNGAAPATTHITAVFNDGRTLTQDLISKADAVQPGYIFTVDGQVFPDELVIYNGTDAVASSECCANFRFAALTGRFHENLPVSECLLYTPMMRAGAAIENADADQSEILLPDGTSAQFYCFIKGTGAVLPDLYLSANACTPVSVHCSDKLVCAGIAADAIRKAYYVELLLNDGTDEGRQSAVQEISPDSIEAGADATFTVPVLRGNPGLCILILDCGDRYKTCPLSVEKALS